MIGSTSNKGYEKEPLPPAKGSWVIILLILVFIGKIHENVSFLAGIPMGKIAVGVAFVFYLFSPKPSNRPRLTSFLQVRYIIALIIISVLSIPLGVWPSFSLEYLTGSYLNTIIFFFLIVLLIRSEKDLDMVYWGLALTVLIVCQASIRHYGGGRLEVGSYDPNDLASILVIVAPLLLYNTMHPSKVRKVVSFVLLCLAFYVIVRTQSRGGFLGLITVGIVIYFWERKRHKAKMIVAALLFGGMLLLAGPDEFISRMQSIVYAEEDYNRSEEFGRLEVWKRTLAVISSRPILGSGVGAICVATGQEFGDETRYAWYTSHNTYLQITGDIGIIGGIAFIALLLHTIISLRKTASTTSIYQETTNTSNHNTLQAFAKALHIGMFGFMVTGVFLSHAYFNTLYLYLALSANIEWLTQKPTNTVNQR